MYAASSNDEKVQ